MARFRKIDVRMWGDERFRALSAPPPNGRDCWIHLLTNRETSSIPGVYRAYEGGLAADLGWPLEGFREAFREVSAKGMARADWRAGIVLIPGAVKHNKPESPNVVRGWRTPWEELPECDLKTEAYHHLKAFVGGLGEGYAKAFREAFPEPSPKTMANQEQEQEQDLKDLSLIAPGEEPKKQRFDFERIYAAYPRKVGKTKGLERCRREVKTQGDFSALEAAVANYAAYVKGEKPEFIKHFSTFAGEWRDWVTPPSTVVNDGPKTVESDFYANLRRQTVERAAADAAKTSALEAERAVSEEVPRGEVLALFAKAAGAKRLPTGGG